MNTDEWIKLDNLEQAIERHKVGHEVKYTYEDNINSCLLDVMSFEVYIKMPNKYTFFCRPTPKETYTLEYICARWWRPIKWDDTYRKVQDISPLHSQVLFFTHNLLEDEKKESWTNISDLSDPDKWTGKTLAELQEDMNEEG